MSLSLGSTTIGSLYLGSTKIGEAYLGGTKVYASTPVDPYNPLNLPQFTIRARFAPGYTPSMGTSQTLVNAATNTWDICEQHGNITLFESNTSLIEILGANTTGAMWCKKMFYNCTALQRVAIFDTREFDDFSSMFYDCTSLVRVPLFNMSGTSLSQWASVLGMFRGCTAVETGALDLYNHLAAVFPASGNHSDCFRNCGSGTVRGQAELGQIPASWGGTGA